MAIDYGSTFRTEIESSDPKLSGYDEVGYIQIFAFEFLAQTRDPEVFKLIRDSASLLLKQKMFPGVFVGYVLLVALVKAGKNPESFKLWLAEIDDFITKTPHLLQESYLEEMVKQSARPEDLHQRLMEKYPEFAALCDGDQLSKPGGTETSAPGQEEKK